MKQGIPRGIMAVLVLIWIILAAPVAAYAEYTPVSRDSYARVLQVIDGDALMIALDDTQQIALVRLAGIATRGNDEAFSYLTTQLLGRDVLVALDDYYDGMMVDGRWTPVYVYHNQTLYNQVLLQKGLARMDDGYRHFALYNALAYSEYTARSRGVGMWATDPLYYSRTALTWAYDRVNINTATQAQLMDAMPDITASTAKAIVRQRIDAPFADESEIVFPGGLTQEEYDRYRYLLTVYTNINTATLGELRMTGFSYSEARVVIAYREEQWFTAIYQLSALDIISYDKYRDIQPFITVRD